MSARLRLRRADGRVYLDRYGFEFPSKREATDERPGRAPFFGVFLHRMDAPDPGIDLHDHPWWFGSLILWGGYVEERATARDAPGLAAIAEQFPTCTRGVVERRRWLSWRTMRLDECHRIVGLGGRRAWTLVIHGPVRRGWGFFLPDGWMDWRTYDRTIRAERRDMYAEISNDERVPNR